MKAFSNARIVPFAFALFFAPIAILGQTTHWGMSASGGASGIGTIFTITEANVFTKRYDFKRNAGGNPKSDLMKATNGKYYGVTELGGASGLGTLFSYDPATGVYTTLYEMTSTNGGQPIRGVVQAGNGRLYGLCTTGGTNGHGTLWEYNITTSVFTKKVDFNSATNGRTPRSRLVVASNGTLYGVTQLGGGNNRGILFSYVAAATSVTVRYTFDLANGGQPFSGMVMASNNVLYGTTQVGGANGVGVIYSFNTTSNTYTKLHDLDPALLEGSFPLGEMVASGSMLYGTTSDGGANSQGVIFSWNITTGTYSKLYDLNTGAGGNTPYGRLIVAASGLIYGVTRNGGTLDKGVLFSFNPTGSVYTPLVSLNAISASDTWSGLLEDPAGTLWGLSNSGGSVNSGALFKYVVSSGTLTEVVPMAFALGANPKGRLLRATDGKFYGLTSAGGQNSLGILFSFDPATSTFTRLQDLGGGLGGAPLGTLVEVSGKFYGLCNNGGADNGGTLFEYDLATATFTKKLDLNFSTGRAPHNGLILASNGKLYGVTSQGGTNSYGTLFEYVPASNTLTVRYSFTTVSGTAPEGDLMQANNGLLYGTLSQNAALGAGALYSFNTATNTFTKLHDFDDAEGGNPSCELMQASNGKLYGIASAGGTYNYGAIFSWDVTTSTFDPGLFAFDAPQGKSSEAGLLEGTDGRLYGVCPQGGINDLGTIFRYNITANTVTVLKNLAATDGQNPFNGLVRDIIPTPSSVSLAARVFLEGPFNSGTGLMADALRSLAGFPLTEPFTSNGFTHVGGGGGETISASVLSVSGNDAIVDWIMLELRSTTLPYPVVATRSALVQRDGDVVDLNGTSPVTFNVAPGSYRISVRHRNHLGCMTNDNVSLSASPYALDLTSGSVTTYGTDAQKIIGSARVLWAGNVTPDNTLKYTGASNDRDPILVRVGGTVPTNTAMGYWIEDVNLDGIVKYTGASNDRDPILVNVGGTVPTNTRPQQLP